MENGPRNTILLIQDDNASLLEPNENLGRRAQGPYDTAHEGLREEM